jgi:hypothetical protein
MKENCLTDLCHLRCYYFLAFIFYLYSHGEIAQMKIKMAAGRDKRTCNEENKTEEMLKKSVTLG